MLISEPGLTKSSLNFHWQVLSAPSAKSDYRPRKLSMGFSKPNKGHHFCLTSLGRGEILSTKMLGIIRTAIGVNGTFASLPCLGKRTMPGNSVRLPSLTVEIAKSKW